MKTLQLEANKRTNIGKTVKNLRKEGVVPGTVYGKTTEAITVQVNIEKFTHTYRQAGETGVISLSIDGENHPVLVKNVQIDPVSGNVLHIEFHQVNLKEKIKANIPLLITGESLAIKEKTGTLLQLLNEVEVEALPTDLPEHIEVDITSLANVNDHMLVKDLSIPEKVELMTDPDIMVVKIGELVAPEPEPVASVEEAPVAGESESEEKGEGEGAPEKQEEPAKNE